ncbi:VOC family protein [Micrococcus endophyticus]|uniref:VOC family protein n=1 Tax=Micrococcus endophyticus TaxID=455343 RepID=UPI0035A8EFFD
MDPHAVAEFWRELMGWDVSEPDSYEPGSDECYLVTPHGYTVLFHKVPDAKRVKNRAHMDLAVEDGTRDEEVERALRIGAVMVDDRRGAVPGRGPGASPGHGVGMPPVTAVAAPMPESPPVRSALRPVRRPVPR